VDPKKRIRRVVERVNDTEQFRNLHIGKKCFVCGAGVSIGHMDLSEIHQYPVICVNSSVLLMPWNDPGDVSYRFWVSTDILCMQWDYFWDKVAKGECTRLVRNSWARNSANLKGVKINFYAPRRTSSSLDWKEPGLLAGSSILSAIDLSLLMGCKKIFLLGVDHRIVSNASHFWENWPVKERPKREGKPGNYMPCQRQQVRVFKSNHRYFDMFNSYSKRLDSKIYNCSNISEVESFEKISLEDALKL